jgi:6-pyruvoyltetrahydropterin/6-carboxytetrahydropterin synthase
MILRQRFKFEAAHRLPGYEGPCARPHGHTYHLTVSLEGPIDAASGMCVDFFEVDRRVREQVLSRLDHADINEVLANPTAENIAVWIWGSLKPALPELVEVELFETTESSVVYRGA